LYHFPKNTSHCRILGPADDDDDDDDDDDYDDDDVNDGSQAM